MQPILDKILDKVFSGRWILCVMFGTTACIALLKGIISADAFLGLAAGSLTGYQMKSRIGENPLKSKPNGS